MDLFEIRAIATSVLGEMFSSPESNLFTAYDKIWSSWLERYFIFLLIKRRHDKNIEIRLNWIEYCYPLIKNHPSVAHDVAGKFFQTYG